MKNVIVLLYLLATTCFVYSFSIDNGITVQTEITVTQEASQDYAANKGMDSLVDDIVGVTDIVRDEHGKRFIKSANRSSLIELVQQIGFVLLGTAVTLSMRRGSKRVITRA